jgi:hypothetical protein
MESDPKKKGIERASDQTLIRLLNFALDRSPAGPRMRQTPPTTREEIIIQLHQIGVTW